MEAFFSAGGVLLLLGAGVFVAKKLGYEFRHATDAGNGKDPALIASVKAAKARMVARSAAKAAADAKADSENAADEKLLADAIAEAQAPVVPVAAK